MNRMCVHDVDKRLPQNIICKKYSTKLLPTAIATDLVHTPIKDLGLAYRQHCNAIAPIEYITSVMSPHCMFWEPSEDSLTKKQCIY